MGDYYNKTRAPVGVTLRRGGSMSVGPKTWCYIAPEDEGTPGLAETVRKGFLVRSLVPITDLAAVTPPVAPSVSVSSAPLAVVSSSTTFVPESAAPSVSTPERAPEAPPVVEQKQFKRNK